MNHVEKINYLIENDYFYEASLLISNRIDLEGDKVWLLNTLNRNRLEKNRSPYSDKLIDDALKKSKNIIEPKEVVVNSFPSLLSEKVLVTPPKIGCNHYIFKENQFERPLNEVLEIDGGIISIDFSKNYSIEYYIFDSEGRYLKQCSFGESPFIIKNGMHSTNGKVAFIDDRHNKFNVCHLIADKVSRFYRTVFNSSDIDTALILSINDYTKKLFNILEVDVFDLSRFKGRRVSIQFKKIAFCSSSSVGFRHPAQYCDYFFHYAIDRIKSKVSLENEGFPKKIFIDRSRGLTRNIVNDMEFDDILSKYDICRCFLEDYSVDEQIKLFMNADLVIGVHGAGLVNIAFCKKDADIIEILPPLCATNAFWLISKSRGGSYNAFISDDESLDLSNIDYKSHVHNARKYNARNISINCSLFESTFYEILAG